MPSLVDAVSLLHTILNTAEETKSLVKKVRTINENTAKELHGYITELIELLDVLIDYKVIPEILINFWKDAFDGYRKDLFGYATESAGITIAEVHDKDDELTPYSVLRENILYSLNELIEHISNAINHINKRIESGNINIYAESSQVSIEFEKITQFVNFYKDAKTWLRNHSDRLYHYTTVTLEDVIYEVKDLIELIDDLKIYVINTMAFARKFNMYDLMDDVIWIKNAFDMIADAPNIVKLAINETDESTIEKYNEMLIDSLILIDTFLPKFESVLDIMYQRVTSKQTK
jgi:hypothetical protein